MPALYILRHGKAENTSPDIERNLSNAGMEDIKNIAGVFKAKNIIVDKTIYSNAARAKQTAMIMCEDLNIPSDNKKEDARIYNATVDELQTVISEIDDSLESILLVGHNPGFADLVLTLCEEPVHLSAGNVAVVQADSWEDIRNSKARLVDKF